MGVSETAFDGIAQNFADYAQTTRGYVRYELTHANLQPFLEEKPMSVVDVGGGSGIDALWLAEQGHTVTVVEPAQDQVELLRKELARHPKNIRQSVEVVQGSTKDIADQAGTFDLVLSHGVAMYVAKPEDFFWSLIHLAKVGGLVSILEKGYEGTRQRLQSRGDQAALQNLEVTHRFVNNMGREVHAFMPEEILGMVRASGAKTLKWSGVRVVSDAIDRPIDEMSEAELKQLVKQEARAGRDLSQRASGQMLHFIARRREESPDYPLLW
ncbi:MAG: hypothetical protein QG553_808 [Patescibacteria group bacterium]|nr:hypothetical protein [Patescibacteria group bacterium]